MTDIKPPCRGFIFFTILKVKFCVFVGAKGKKMLDNDSTGARYSAAGGEALPHQSTLRCSEALLPKKREEDDGIHKELPAERRADG